MTTTAQFVDAPASVASARHFVMAALGHRPQALREQVALMVSELATNAVQHAGTGFTVTIEESEAGSDGSDPAAGGSVRVEVRDGGEGSPTLRTPPPTDPRGRGLLIVQAISRDWGVDEKAGSTAVWFTV